MHENRLGWKSDDRMIVVGEPGMLPALKKEIMFKYKLLRGSDGRLTRNLFLAASLLLGGYSVFSWASISSIAMNVNVLSNCKFASGATDMSFGSYDPTVNNVATPLDTATTFTLRCSKGSSAEVSISGGLYPANNMRRMRSGNDYLSYNLYKNSARKAVWDTTQTVNYTAASSVPQVFTIYGQIPAGQDTIGPGSYADTVTVTVTF